MKALLLLPFLPFLLAERLAANPAPEAGIPAEMQEIFRNSRASEGNRIDSDVGRGEELATASAPPRKARRRLDH